MYTVRDICKVMDAWAPPGWAYAWDKSGLAVGQHSQEVSVVVVGLSVTKELVAMAKDSGAQLVVTHHPLIWSPLTRLDPSDTQTALCLDLAQHGIAAYSAHTNLDVAPDGVNACLASSLGLSHTETLFPAPHAKTVKLTIFVPESHLAPLREAMSQAGGGIIGNYAECSFSLSGTGTFRPTAGADPYSGAIGTLSEEPERRLEMLVPEAILGNVLKAARSAHPYDEMAYDVYPLANTVPGTGLGLVGELPEAKIATDFARYVAQRLQADHVRFVGPADRMVRRVAVMGGSGGGEAGKIDSRIDAFVTGDLKYHDALDAAERGLVVIDAGHAASEKGIVPVIADRLKQHLPRLKTIAYLEPELFRVINP